MRYRFTGYKKFLDPEGYPAITPPWGTLNAINLNTGEYAWKIPLGEYPELAAKGLKNTGSENYGGPDRDRGRAGVYRRVTISTGSFAPSINRRANCCGRRRCLFPATLRQLLTKLMDASMWSLLPAAAKIPSKVGRSLRGLRASSRRLGLAGGRASRPSSRAVTPGLHSLVRSF